jgi:hypothetical protein
MAEYQRSSDKSDCHEKEWSTETVYEGPNECKVERILLHYGVPETQYMQKLRADLWRNGV